MTRPRGKALLDDPARNKSTAFTRDEREAYGLRGLLPYQVSSMATQQRRVLSNLRRKADDIDKYIFLSALQDRNQRLFYRTAIDHIEEILPLIYTPTVGEACRQFAHIFRRPQGLYITPEDRGEIRRLLANWPADDVRVIVITDGERILGLGDLGANGMGIPIGKLALYVACGGVDPQQCMPVMFDVGTNNRALRDDPLYLGYPHPRLAGEAYDALMDEFVEAVQERFPEALIQFEDFLSPTAFRLLERHAPGARCFNDDIQGTAAVAVAGVYASTRITGKALGDQRFLFLGAGSAAAGIAELMVTALRAEGLDETEARRRIAFADSHGLITADREGVSAQVAPFARDCEPMGFEAAIDALAPDVLIGATGAGGAFTETVVRRMAAVNERPVIFALSNPTDRAECTAEQAYRWTDGRAVFASGSPFGAVSHGDRTFRPGQANNVYIFPGVGLGVLASGAERIDAWMFTAAARTLADAVTEAELDAGAVYPRLPRIREVSRDIAAAVYRQAADEGLALRDMPADPAGHLDALMYDPSY